ncbi:MAG: hypothetical protein GC146_16230 [Limimaricola sp.]|uniref:hypothetical protein n=1 Tax=Limimaricola sp. TaxID=2211665 RepID=UPI001D4E5229|nr:hypothetical protein [Limimaricola sp.]MBI1418765.1 hypothetical protein [Limimaricola sp.]
MSHPEPPDLADCLFIAITLPTFTSPDNPLMKLGESIKALLRQKWCGNATIARQVAWLPQPMHNMWKRRASLSKIARRTRHDVVLAPRGTNG